MGMAASQGRLLALTARKNSIGYQLQSLSLEKMSLTREMQKISKEYNSALSAKKLKWSNNSGVDYVDLSYAAIMKPSAVNQNKPYIISNQSGKIVLDKKYKELAEKISPDGSAGGDYESNRTEILASVLNINASTITGDANQNNNLNSLREDAIKKRNEYNDWKNREDRQAGGSNVDYKSTSDLRKLAGLKEIVDYSGDWRSSVTSIVNQIKNNLGKYFANDSGEALGGIKEKDNFYNACENFINGIPQDGAKKEASPAYLDKDHNRINVEQILASILNGAKLTKDDKGGFLTRNTDNPQWKKWYDELNNKYDAWKTAEAEFKKASGEAVSAFGQDKRTEIEFYDALFTAIAENGWVYDTQVEDNDYLNNMFQNNQFYITEVTNNEDYGEEYAEYKNRKYDYSTDLASNFEKMFFVNDEDIRQEALTNYEYKKAKIKVKEERIDTRMKDLETEQSAITNMIKGVETVRNDNTETYFSIFS